MDSKIMSMLLLLLAIFQTTIEYGNNWNPHRQPKVMGDKIQLRLLNPSRKNIQQKIVVYHNFFRSKVQPSAANMLKMKWHSGAARSAQRWAEKCLLLTHDDMNGRYIENYGACGQNIFIATHKVPWLFAIKTWWLEKDYYRYGYQNNLTVTGHYTQMIWASTHEIGCGIAKCYHHARKDHARNHHEGNTTNTRGHKKLFYNYICNYCPIGNRPGQLYRPYRRGKPCQLCRSNCQRKLCLNSCEAANSWSNCRQLHKVHPHWLCHTYTPKGRERFNYCKATCTCKHQIYD